MRQRVHVMFPQLYNDPWKHLMTDNLLDDDVFKEVEKYAVDTFSYVTKHVLENHSVLDNSRMYQLLAPVILKLKDDYFDLLNIGNKELPEKYYPYVQFNICPLGFKWKDIHVDAPRKLMTTVLYLNPAVSDGTDLYSKKDEASLEKTVDWKKNRSVSFVSQADTKFKQTWHNYKNSLSPLRMSVNLILCANINGKYY